MTRADAELDALRDVLHGQRAHVLGILDGLSDEQLRRPVLTSGWSCLALLHHLTEDVERFWFAGVIAGDPEATGRFAAGSEAHWSLPDGMTAAEVFADYRAAAARSDAVLAAVVSPEQPPAVWPVELWPHWRLPDIRRTLLHVITELACHSGHLDAARELIDGTAWLGGNPYGGQGG